MATPSTDDPKAVAARTAPTLACPVYAATDGADVKQADLVLTRRVFKTPEEEALAIEDFKALVDDGISVEKAFRFALSDDTSGSASFAGWKSSRLKG